jgi:hypothetical protein
LIYSLSTIILIISKNEMYLAHLGGNS